MGLFSKKEQKPDAGKTGYEEALDWEASRIAIIEASERRAWKVAMAASIVAVLSLAAITLMMPLKQTRPYVIRVDNHTGATDIVTTLADQRVGYEDVLDKYWLAKFIRARETYDWWTIQNDYKEVGMLSTSEVGKDYLALFEGKNALDKVYGKSIKTTVEVLSVVPNGRGIATVRLIKKTMRTDAGEATATITKWIATIGYEYRNPSKIRESLRLVNPFGFQVRSYRLDPELVDTPEGANRTAGIESPQTEVEGDQ
jgi:type IV secretion system protein VirB8